MLRASLESIAKVAGIVASHEERITALEATVGRIIEFMAKREGYAEGFLDAAVTQEASEFGSAHRFWPTGEGPHGPGKQVITHTQQLMIELKITKAGS